MALKFGTITPPIAVGAGPGSLSDRDTVDTQLIQLAQVAGTTAVTPPADDLSPAYQKGKSDQELQDLINDANKQIEENAPERQSSEKEAADALTNDDPLAIRIKNHAGAFFSDLGRGTVEGPVQVVGGVVDAVNNTLNTLDSLAEWLNENVADLQIVPKEDVELEIPSPEKGTTITGGIQRGITQFLTGFIPALRGIRKAGGGVATTRLGQVAQVEGAAATAGVMVFDPHEKRLSNLIQESEALANPVNEYLQSDPEDTDAEGRFKNAIESLGFGVFAEGLLRGIRAVLANRKAAGVKPGHPLAEPDDRIVQQLGDPEAPLFTNEAGEAFIRGEIPTEALAFQMNWSKFTSSEMIEDTVERVAQLMGKELDLARRGVIGDDALLDLATQLGMTPTGMLKMRGGTGFKAEEILAMKTILEASATKLQDMASIAANSVDETDMFAALKMMDIHSAIQMQFQGAASEAGRALRALQLPIGSTAKQIADLQTMLMQQGGPDQVRSLMNAISGIADPKDLNALIRGNFGKRAMDMVVEAWYFALLSGPQTQAVNVTSTALNVLWQIPERALAARIGQLRGSNNSVAVGEATQMFYGMIGAMRDGFRIAGRTFRTGDVPDNLLKTEARVHRAISAKNFGLTGAEGSMGKFMERFTDGVGEFVRIPSRFLMTEDVFFKTLGRSMQMRALAYRTAVGEGLEGQAMANRMREILKKPDNHMLQEAEEFANSIAFTTPLGQAGRGFQQLTNQVPALKFIIPFTRVPTNLVKWTGRRTPLGLLSKSIRQDIARGGAAGDLALARMTIGSGLAMVMVDQVLKGNATGGGPTDKALARTWRRTHQPFSIKVGDTWYSYNRSDPFGLLMGVAASYAEVGGQMDDETAAEFTTAIAIATSKSAFNKTWMRGPAEALDALTQPEIYGERFLQNFAGTLLVPTGSAQIARTIDPVWREVNSLSDAIRARFPGYSKDLPPMRNLWGQPILLEGGLGPDIISPIYKYGQKDRPIDEWLLANKVNVEMPSKTQFDIELTPKEYSEFVEDAGNRLKMPGTNKGLYDTLNAMIGGKHRLSGQWQTATDGPEGGRSIIVRSLIQAFRDLARGKMAKDVEFSKKIKTKVREKSDAVRIGLSPQAK